jgi:hypothetical protein
MSVDTAARKLTSLHSAILAAHEQLSVTHEYAGAVHVPFRPLM